MFRKGHRLFSAASIGLILIAVLHTIGHFAPPPNDLVMTALLTAMQSYRFDLGIASPSMLDIFESLNLTFSIMVAWAGLTNLMIAHNAGLRDALMRRACALNIVVIAVLLALFVVYRVPPPAITLAVVEILFVIAFVGLRQGN